MVKTRLIWLCRGWSSIHESRYIKPDWLQDSPSGMDDIRHMTYILFWPWQIWRMHLLICCGLSKIYLAHEPIGWVLEKKRGIKRDENIMKIKISSWWGWCFSQWFSCQAPYHMTASYEELENNFCFVGSGKGCWGWLLMSTLKSVSQLFRLLTLRFHLFICLNIYPIFCSSATHHPWILAFRIISFKNMDRTPTCETQRWPRKRYNWEHLAFLWGSSALFHGEMGWKAIQKPCGISAQ